MKAPKKYTSSGGLNRYVWPDIEWLEDQYWIQGKSANQISQEFGMDATTVRRWMDELDIPRRTPSEVKEGSRNPNWLDGAFEGASCHSARARKVMRKSGKPRVCEWCGAAPNKPLGRKGQIQVHHKDHDSGNHDLANLQYLCYFCHQFETALWHLLKQNKIDLICEGNQMHITFRKGE